MTLKTFRRVEVRFSLGFCMIKLPSSLFLFWKNNLESGWNNNLQRINPKLIQKRFYNRETITALNYEIY